MPHFFGDRMFVVIFRIKGAFFTAKVIVNQLSIIKNLKFTPLSKNSVLYYIIADTEIEENSFLYCTVYYL